MSLRGWFQRHYNLPVTDPRLQNATEDDILEDYLCHVIWQAEMWPDKEAQEEWEEEMKASPDAFKKWQDEVSANLQKHYKPKPLPVPQVPKKLARVRINIHG